MSKSEGTEKRAGVQGGRDAAPPLLNDEQRHAFDRAVAEFNAGYYFECHDTLEDMWTGIRGPSRDFFQGLIQVSVAFYHLGNANSVGASSMMRRAVPGVAGCPCR